VIFSTAALWRFLGSWQSCTLARFEVYLLIRRECSFDRLATSLIFFLVTCNFHDAEGFLAWDQVCARLWEFKLPRRTSLCSLFLFSPWSAFLSSFDLNLIFHSVTFFFFFRISTRIFWISSWDVLSQSFVLRKSSTSFKLKPISELSHFWRWDVKTSFSSNVCNIASENEFSKSFLLTPTHCNLCYNCHVPLFCPALASGWSQHQEF
jgi:hypothetical protein